MYVANTQRVQHCSKVEATVILKLHQGASAKRAVHRLAVAFFGSFFSTKKRTIGIIKSKLSFHHS
jgi:hypothetical protein